MRVSRSYKTGLVVCDQQAFTDNAHLKDGVNMGLFPRTHFPHAMNCSEKPGLKWAVGMTPAPSGEGDDTCSRWRVTRVLSRCWGTVTRCWNRHDQ